MNSVFVEAKWIWRKGCEAENDYAEFSDSFDYRGGEALLRISVCGDYSLFINGVFVESNQFGDFEHYKIYDEIDIEPYIKEGSNTISILGWYFGVAGMRYATSSPGLIYEVATGDKVAAYSDSTTMSRRSLSYKSGEFRQITSQLGYSFSYDANSEDGWMVGETTGFEPSELVEHSRSLYIRPTEKLRLGDAVYGKVSRSDNSYIIDLGEEYVGLATLSLASDVVQTVTVCYGELLVDGHVKRKIGNRDFSFDYIAKPGDNHYTNYMLRLACRYIEIYSEHPVDIEKVGIIQQYYPVSVRKKDFSDELDRRIYDVCVNTLNLCMMEHYVDCPWREQCLYAFDSRNQMLSGYVVYEGGNFEYARANLLLMSKDNREDGLLSICFPATRDLVIPSFSLYYMLAVKEYMEYSGDLSLGEEVFGKMESILAVFEANVKDGLLWKIEGENKWTFYDWSEYAYSNIYFEKGGSDFLINAIFVIALRSFADICKKLGKTNRFSGLAEKVSAVAGERFYNSDTGLYYIENISEKTTELANSLAVLSGIADGEGAEHICKALADGSLTECSLSMKTLKYDAMLSVDEQYKDAVFAEIRDTYKKMLDAGSTTVWETIDGAAAFEDAGSLCHGWSSIPVYYYNKFGR